MRRPLTLTLFCLALSGATACDSALAPPSERAVHEVGEPVTRLNGTIAWIGIEGGFWAIRGDDGVLYDPHPTIPAEFREDGLRVHFAADPRPDLACFHMVGPIVAVTELSRR